MTFSLKPDDHSIPVYPSGSQPIIPQKRQLIEAKFTIQGKNYKVKIWAKGTDGTLAPNQQKELVNKIELLFKSLDIKLGKKTLLQISPKKVTYQSDKATQKTISLQKKTVSIINQIKTIAHTPMRAMVQKAPETRILPPNVESIRKANASDKAGKSSQPVASPDAGETVKHLFLSESHRYLGSFFDKLIEKFPSKAAELAKLKNATLENLINDIYEGHDEWRTGELIQSKAEEEWGSKNESKRQKAAASLMYNALYEGLCIAEEAGALDIEKLHKDVCLAISKDRMKEKTNAANKIDIQFGFKVATEQPGQPMEVNIHTEQFGDQITSSLEKRVPKANGKLYGVNIHAETVTFRPANGRPLVSTQLRSGSFDFKDIKPASYDIHPLTDKDHQELITHLKELSSQELNQEVNQVRLAGDPEKFSHYIDALKKMGVSPSEITKYQNELREMIENWTIIQNNQKCIEGVYQQVAMLDKDHKLGMHLPNEVVELLSANEELHREGKQNWGMISLQTPVNIMRGEGINKWILKLSKNKHVPGAARKYLKKLANKDMSELDPIHREMVAYQGANKKSPLINQGLYFNIPTNAMGIKRCIINMGPLKWTVRVSDKFNVGIVDKVKAGEVAKMTQDSTEKLYHLASIAEGLVRDKIPNEFDPVKKENLIRYYNSLTSLMDQTFAVQQVDGKTIVMLKDAPGKQAQYEIVGRLTILMQMLNFNTTGHCRSGNNRTAAWLAKSHQIVGAMAASADGSIPAADEMAGRLIGRENNHWSLKVFMNTFKSSLTLQQVNKGTQGTKLNLPEISNETYRKAILKGAFDLAGRYDKSKHEQVRLKRMKIKGQRTKMT